MKKICIYILTITMLCCMTLAGFGIVNSLTKQDVNLSSTVSADIIRIQNEMNNLFIEKETFEQNKNGVEERIDELVSSIESMRIERDEYVAMLSQINEQLADIESRLISGGLSQQELDELYLQKESFEEDKAEIEANISAINTALQDVQTEQESANNSLSELDGYIDNLQIQINNLQASLERLYETVAQLNRNIITGKLSSSRNLNGKNGAVVIDFDLYNSYGTKLSMQSGTVKIGAGVSKVLVSASVSLDRYQVGYNELWLTKNGVSVFNVVGPGFGSGTSAWSNSISLILPPILLSVNEGDLIGIKIYGSDDYIIHTNNLLRTYLTVEVVA